MRKQGWVYVATDEAELKSLLLTRDLHPLFRIGSAGDESLTQSIADFIDKG
jgi:hypothetical protein